MGFSIPSITGQSQSGSDAVLTGLSFGGNFQIGGSGSSMKAAGPEGLASASMSVTPANIGMLGMIAAGAFLLVMIARGK